MQGSRPQRKCTETWAVITTHARHGLLQISSNVDCPVVKPCKPGGHSGVAVLTLARLRIGGATAHMKADAGHIQAQRLCGDQQPERIDWLRAVLVALAHKCARTECWSATAGCPDIPAAASALQQPTQLFHMQRFVSRRTGRGADALHIRVERAYARLTLNKVHKGVSAETRCPPTALGSCSHGTVETCGFPKA